MKSMVAGYALLALAALVGVSVWASGEVGILTAIESLAATPAQGTHPWFLATLLDTYFAFGWFWLWLAWRERHWGARLGWLVAILGLGNIAMALYVLWSLARLPPGRGADALFERRAA